MDIYECGKMELGINGCEIPGKSRQSEIQRQGEKTLSVRPVPLTGPQLECPQNRILILLFQYLPSLKTKSSQRLEGNYIPHLSFRFHKYMQLHLVQAHYQQSKSHNSVLLIIFLIIFRSLFQLSHISSLLSTSLLVIHFSCHSPWKKTKLNSIISTACMKDVTFQEKKKVAINC